MNSTASPLYLYLDIETVPSHDPSILANIIDKHRVPELDLDAIQPAANLKDADKIAADLEKRRAKAKDDHAAALKKESDAVLEDFRKTCLDATTGHIACISAGLGGGGVGHWQSFALRGYGDPDRDPEMDLLPLEEVLDGERGVLASFFDAIERMLFRRAIAERDDNIPIPVVVAHHAAFDVRYIWQRAIILGVSIPDWWPHDARPWDTDRIDDTMTAWAGANGRIGLDRLCRALGIPRKPGDMDGSKVWESVAEGRLDDVVTYCDDDVERLRAVHRRIRGLDVETVVVDAIEWGPGKIISMRSTPLSEGDRP